MGARISAQGPRGKRLHARNHTNLYPPLGCIPWNCIQWKFTFVISGDFWCVIFALRAFAGLPRRPRQDVDQGGQEVGQGLAAASNRRKSEPPRHQLEPQITSLDKYYIS